MSSFQYVLLGGGNAAGYAAHRFVRNGLGPDELCIITDEPVNLFVLSAKVFFTACFLRTAGIEQSLSFPRKTSKIARIP